MSCAKTAEPIEILFGLWARMDPRNHLLDGSLQVQFDITGFVGYNFGSMIASDTRFDARGWVFGVKLSNEDIAEIRCLRVVAMATNFGTKLLLTGFV